MTVVSPWLVNRRFNFNIRHRRCPSLIVQMKSEMIEPGMLVDIKKIKETRDINIGDDEIQIGSAVSGAEIGEHAELKALLPGVVEAVQLIGSDQ